MTEMGFEIRKQPCSACPYRQDVPSGVWAAETYDKLLPYDNVTYDQPPEPFGCHATPEHLCHGWAAVHSNRGQAYELLSLRLLWARGIDAVIPEAAVPMFSSGTEAAEHGKRDILNPSPEAKATVEKLTRKYDRLDYA